MNKSLWLLLLIPLLSAVAKADGKALLVSVSQYQYPEAFSPGIENLNLPGVENDVKKMLATVQQLGIAPENTLILKNASATEQNIKWAIRNHFMGMPENSRALIYFTGHGTVIWDSNGDEEDHTDEVLLTYDARFIKTGKQYELHGKIIDDEVNDLLKQVPSKRLLFIVDACHSGNINKSMTISTVPSVKTKYAKNPHLLNDPRYQAYINNDMSSMKKGLWDNLTRKFGLDLPTKEVGRIFFTATGESGRAISLPDGSVFTSNLYETMSLLTQENSSERIDLQKINSQISEAFAIQFPQSESKPQLFGDRQLIKQGF